MTVHAVDERAHEPGPSNRWSETWHLDVATDDQDPPKPFGAHNGR